MRKRDLFQALIQGVLLITFLFLFVGCGGSFPTVTIKSEPLSIGAFSQTALDLEGVEEFKFCVTRIKFLGEEPAEEGEEADQFRVAPGLVDLSSGAESVWGDVELPAEGFIVTKIFVKVHQDPELCGVDYSLRFNGLSTKQDVEFKFSFGSGVEIGDGDAIRLNLDFVVENLLERAQNGEINSLKIWMDTLEGEAELE